MPMKLIGVLALFIFILITMPQNTLLLNIQAVFETLDISIWDSFSKYNNSDSLKNYFVLFLKLNLIETNTWNKRPSRNARNMRPNYPESRPPSRSRSFNNRTREISGQNILTFPPLTTWWYTAMELQSNRQNNTGIIYSTGTATIADIGPQMQLKGGTIN